MGGNPGQFPPVFQDLYSTGKNIDSIDFCFKKVLTLVDGQWDVKVVTRIAYSNQNYSFIHPSYYREKSFRQKSLDKFCVTNFNLTLLVFILFDFLLLIYENEVWVKILQIGED